MIRWRVGLCLMALVLCADIEVLLHAQGSAGKVRVYSVEDGIAAPELLPADLPLPVMAKCKTKNQRTLHTEIALVVDDEGQPHNLSFLRSTGVDFDNMVLRLAAANRFKPATSDGKPVPAWQALVDDFSVCEEKIKDSDGHKILTYRLVAPPVQTLRPIRRMANDVRYAAAQSLTDFSKVDPPRAGGSTVAPVPLLTPEAEFSNYARKKKIQGECLVTLVVDAQGMPQNPRVVRSIETSLDKKALEAVARYRFKPAMKDGLEPVPILITIAVNFRLY